MTAYVDSLFAEGSPLLVSEGVIECPTLDCGAPCNKSDLGDDGECRYCGVRIKHPLWPATPGFASDDQALAEKQESFESAIRALREARNEIADELCERPGVLKGARGMLLRMLDHVIDEIEMWGAP